MPGPTLSRTEREILSTAAKLEASGVKVCWRNLGRRVEYVVDGKPHKVFTSATDQAHAALVRKAKEFYAMELRAHVEAKQAAPKAGGSQAGSVEVAALPDVRGVETLPVVRNAIAGGTHKERRDADEGSGLDVCSALSDASFAAGRAGADAGENLAPAV
jgi:hypothetical protein